MSSFFEQRSRSLRNVHKSVTLSLPSADALLSEIDRALRILSTQAHATRPSPAQHIPQPESLSDTEKKPQLA